MDMLISLLTFDSLMKVCFGSLIGLCLGLTGVGGGVLIIPVLQVVFGMQVVMAVGTASLISTIVKVNAGIGHIRAGNVEWRALKWMLIGSVPMVLCTTEAIVFLNQNPKTASVITFVIENTIVLVMLFALYTLYRKYRAPAQALQEKLFSNKLAVGAGLSCGSVLGSTGVGGGVLLLPAFNTLLGLDIKKSIGSSLVLALILSALTAMSYSKSGQSDIITAILMSLGAFIGVPIAIKLMKRLSDKQIYLTTITIIIISLCLMMI